MNTAQNGKGSARRPGRAGAYEAGYADIRWRRPIYIHGVRMLHREEINMKDCTTCKKRPRPGADFKKSACARCRPWEPQDDKATVQATDGMIAAAIRRIREHGLPGPSVLRS